MANRIHNLIIDRAFPGLSNAERGWIKSGSWEAGVAAQHSNEETDLCPFRLGLAVGATLKLFGETFGQDRLAQATGGVIFGSENDPSVKAIHAQYSLPGSKPSGEDEALYSYRL